MVVIWLMVTWQTPSAFILVHTLLWTRYDWLERSLGIPYGIPRDTASAIFHWTQSGYETSQKPPVVRWGYAPASARHSGNSQPEALKSTAMTALEVGWLIFHVLSYLTTVLVPDFGNLNSKWVCGCSQPFWVWPLTCNNLFQQKKKK